MAKATEASLARKGAILVKWGFEKYRSGFRRITRRSQLHFEAADWHGVQRDMVERLTLYTTVVRRVLAELERVFGAAGRDEELWAEMKGEYAALMGGRGDRELAETFFNSVTRKVFTTVGVRSEREFVSLDGGDDHAARVVPVRTYPGTPLTSPIGQQILDDYAFAVPYADYEGDAIDDQVIRIDVKAKDDMAEFKLRISARVIRNRTDRQELALKFEEMDSQVYDFFEQCLSRRFKR